MGPEVDGHGFRLTIGPNVQRLNLTSQIVMTRQQVLDLYFLDARHKLIEIAAFLDRVERVDGQDDFRLKAFRTALAGLTCNKKQKAKNALLAFSDLTTKPTDKATTKAACGAVPEK
jgi:hypothetical protein